MSVCQWKVDCLKSGPGPGGSQMFGSRSRYGWTWTRIIAPGPAGEWTGPRVQTWTGPGPNLVMNSPKKIPLKQAKEHIFWTITYKDMDKMIKITKNSRCT